jgi:hypothetical protein
MTLYYGLVVIMSHIIMFLIMTYNFGIIVSIILGNAFGYFIFGLTCPVSDNPQQFR